MSQYNSTHCICFSLWLTEGLCLVCNTPRAGSAYNKKLVDFLSKGRETDKKHFPQKETKNNDSAPRAER